MRLETVQTFGVELELESSKVVVCPAGAGPSVGTL